MLTAQELKAKLQVEDIINILKILGGEPALLSRGSGDVIVSKTICHRGGDSRKLEYYVDSGYFHCYTKCGDTFDIIELVCRVRKCKMYDAINFIALKCGISTLRYGFGNEQEVLGRVSDWDFIDDLCDKPTPHRTLKIDYYNKEVFNTFLHFGHDSWVKDGISVNSMKKYEIMYCVAKQCIIIPHYDILGGLMGIRRRAILDDDVEMGKYTPFFDGRTLYSHPLSQNLYGLHLNLEAIVRQEAIVLFEGEKSVLQLDTFYGEDNISTALCGNNLSNIQRDIIVELGVKDVYVALDKQFHDDDGEAQKQWAKHIRERIVNKLAPYCNVFILWDKEGRIGYKDSPSDRGKEIYETMLRESVYASSATIVKK